MVQVAANDSRPQKGASERTHHPPSMGKPCSLIIINGPPQKFASAHSGAIAPYKARGWVKIRLSELERHVNRMLDHVAAVKVRVCARSGLSNVA